MDKAKTQIVAKYLQKKSMIPKEIQENMVQILAEDSPAYETVKKWAAKFKQSRDSRDDDPLSSYPKNSTNDEHIDIIHYMVLDDRHLTVQKIIS